MMVWKDTVTSVSDRVFPGLCHKIQDNINENQVFSNLPLQMALYFNVIFAPFWMLVLIIFLNSHYQYYNELYKLIIIAIIATVFTVEIVRLYLGYEGNLKDKIPELAGFWMLSILLQFPLQTFLLFNPHFSFNVIEVVAQSIIFVMLCFQLVSGYCALKYTATQQAIYFRIMKLNNNTSKIKT